jgi:hypothetical protein
VAAPELSAREGEAGATWQRRSHLGREVRSGGEKHVAAPELSSRGGRARSHETHDSAAAHLEREARPRAEKHVAASKPTSARKCGLKL